MERRKVGEGRGRGEKVEKKEQVTGKGKEGMCKVKEGWRMKKERSEGGPVSASSPPNRWSALLGTGGIQCSPAVYVIYVYSCVCAGACVRACDWYVHVHVVCMRVHDICDWYVHVHVVCIHVVCMRVYVCVCVHVCEDMIGMRGVRVQCVYINMCVCVCKCVCVHTAPNSSANSACSANECARHRSGHTGKGK
jgi:hypothetical protein